MAQIYPIREAKFLVSAVKPKQFPAPDLPEIAFAGRSNVGKSTLINNLLSRRNLARTSRTPGRTQTINFFEINKEMYFVDLPGYGFARVPKAVRASWRPMVEGYLLSDRDLRAMVLIIDIRRDPQDEEHNLLAWLEQRDVPPVVIITKADKLSRGKRPVRAEVFRRELGLISPPLLFSALTGEGRAEIWECLLERSGIH
ncbi:MAG: YihA family ribosome biogenesis GTP-binding protein [Deltaproteobacteria bacterium]|nr:YihA family ribosome biogenesis GTP-binding protein [Deltaproteobacteria bacterium]MBW2051094.1 YihA family ribosome biogenesis GTP-binding protein [Deltaproteobacteria bacterium]MBW2140301.1 YihA family ribosome biogenesis GTP-binding protein [Deltaproteobacteria bacterium]MBW2322908.1 YihA family ribosome biogenesis GTP-binding protein [Deltaproteobacteria bacterium]